MYGKDLNNIEWRGKRLTYVVHVSHEDCNSLDSISTTFFVLFSITSWFKKNRFSCNGDHEMK